MNEENEKDTPVLSEQIREAILDEAAALEAFAEMPHPEMEQAVRLIASSLSPLIVSGIGKSGHVGKKIASTFSSIGKPAIFLHAAEASHGDLGLVQSGSVVLVLSNTGETTELSDLLHFIHGADAKLIALTGRANSTLARAADIVIAYGEVKEVCPNRLAPTTSTTLSLAIGDALAVGVTTLLGTLPEDFRRYHPGGKLGARLLSVQSLMRRGDQLPLLKLDASMAEAAIQISEKALGCAILTDEHGKIAGIVTDGDMRRNMDRLWEVGAREIASPNPVRVQAQGLASDAVNFMTKRGITNLLIVDEAGKLEGVLNMHDCLRAGVTS